MAKKPTQKSKASSAPNEQKPSLDFTSIVAERIEIETIRMISSSCLQSPSILIGKHNIQLTNTPRYSVDEENHQILVLIDFVLKATAAEEDPGLSIKATFLLVYKCSDLSGLEPIHYESFAVFNGVYNAWPYWREFVQSTTSRMGLPLMTLPVFKPRSEASKAKKSEKKLRASKS
ncbi:MAG: hypothetical protein ABIK28_21795 [Planctomycetota bacterium]